MDPLPVIQSAMDRLSDEIWLLVLSQVAADSLPSLAACMPVSRAWHRLCTDNHVWRAAFLGLNRQLGLDDRLNPPSLHDWTATSWYDLVKDQDAFSRTWAPNKWVTDDHIPIPEDGKRPIQELASFSLTMIDLIGPDPEQTVINIRKAAVDSFHGRADDHSSHNGILAVLADHSAPINDPQNLQQRPSVLNLSRVLHFLNLETLEPFLRLVVPSMPNIPMVPGFVPAHWVQLGHVDAARKQFTLFLRVGSHKTSLRMYSLEQAVSYGMESVLDLQVIASHEFPGHVWFGDQPLHPHPTEPNRLMLMFTNLYTDLVTVHHLDAITFELVHAIEIHAPMGSRHYDADFGTLIITTCEYGAVRIWSADSGECLYAFQVAHMAAVDFAIWRPWVRPGLEREHAKACAFAGVADKPAAYMDPKWLQVLSVTMPLAEFGLNAPMGLALHSARSATSLVPAVFVNESTDPDPDSKTNVPGIVWRGKPVNPPPPPTPENPEPVVFPEDIEAAPLSGNVASVLRYQARHTRLMAFLAGYQLLFTVDLDGVLNVTNMATGKDWGPLVSATQSASEAAQSMPSRLREVCRGESIMSRTLTLNAFEFLTPLRPESPRNDAPRVPPASNDPLADPHLPPLSATTTAPDLLDALLNHPLPEQAASALGSAVLLGTVPLAVIQSVLHQLPDSGMEQDRIDAIFNGLQTGGINTLAQIGEPAVLPLPPAQPVDPPAAEPAPAIDHSVLPTRVLSMATELRTAANIAMDAPSLAESTTAAFASADRASAALAHLESHPPTTADGQPDELAIIATCTRLAVDLVEATRALLTDLIAFLDQARAQLTAAATAAGRTTDELRQDMRSAAQRAQACMRSIELVIDEHAHTATGTVVLWLGAQGHADEAVEEIRSCVGELRAAQLAWVHEYEQCHVLIMRLKVGSAFATVEASADDGFGEGEVAVQQEMGAAEVQGGEQVDESLNDGVPPIGAEPGSQSTQQDSEPVVPEDLVMQVVAMADQLTTAAATALQSSGLESQANAALQLADQIRASMDEVLASSTPTDFANADTTATITLACTESSAQIMTTSCSLTAVLLTELSGQVTSTLTLLTSPAASADADAADVLTQHIRILVDHTRTVLGCIRAVACEFAVQFVDLLQRVLEHAGLAQSHLGALADQVRAQQVELDAALDQATAALGQLTHQLPEPVGAVPGAGGEQGTVGDGEGADGGNDAEGPLAIQSDGEPAPAAQTPTPAPAAAPAPEPVPEPEPEQDQVQQFQQGQADLDEEMMLMDAPGAAWDPDQDASYPFGDVMWLDRSWERILVYRGKSLMVLAKAAPRQDSSAGTNEYDM